MSTTARRSSWVSDVVASLTVASGIGYVAGIYLLSRSLTRPIRKIPQMPIAPASEENWHELECRTSDGLRLAGWLVEPPRPRGCVVCFHGLNESRLQMLGRIAFLTRAGYRCVAFDHRGHGESDGNNSSFGFHEARDVEAVLGLVRERWPHEPCAALGASMGAAALCFAAPDVDAVILEGPYYDMRSTFRARIGTLYPNWLRFFFDGIIWITEQRLGVHVDELTPHRCIGNLAPTPVLLLTGERDAFATPADMERLFACCREPRELAIIPEAGHIDLCEKGGRHYQDTIVNFLERRLLRRHSQAA